MYLKIHVIQYVKIIQRAFCTKSSHGRQVNKIIPLISYSFQLMFWCRAKK